MQCKDVTAHATCSPEAGTRAVAVRTRQAKHTHPDQSWCSGDVGGEASPFTKAGGGLSKRYGAAFIWGQLVFWHKQTVSSCSARPVTCSKASALGLSVPGLSWGSGG